MEIDESLHQIISIYSAIERQSVHLKKNTCTYYELIYILLILIYLLYYFFKYIFFNKYLKTKKIHYFSASRCILRLAGYALEIFNILDCETDSTTSRFNSHTLISMRHDWPHITIYTLFNCNISNLKNNISTHKLLNIGQFFFV